MSQEKFRKDLIISTTVIIIFSSIALYINKQESYTETLKEAIAFMGGSFLMSSLTSKPLKYFIDSLEPYAPILFNTSQQFAKINEYNKKYDKIKHKLSPHNDKTFKIRLNDLLDATKSEFSFNTICQVLDFMLVLESDTEHTYIVDDFIKNVDVFLSNIQLDITEILKENIFKPYICNIFSKEQYICLTPIYLYGESGVGKTHFVHSLSNLLDIPIFETNFSSVGKNDLWYSEKFKSENLDLYTNLVYLAKKNNKNSAILFIDEMDKKINNDPKFISRLLEIISSEKEVNFSTYLNYEVSIKNVIVVCCGNATIESLQKQNNSSSIAALTNRFMTIHFPNFNECLKKKIIEEYISTKFPDFNFKNDKEFNEIITNDNEPGLRKLYMNINYFLNKRSKYHIFKKTHWSE